MSAKICDAHKTYILHMADMRYKNLYASEIFVGSCCMNDTDVISSHSCSIQLPDGDASSPKYKNDGIFLLSLHFRP